MISQAHTHGKLLRIQWFPSMNGEPCYTCLYHNRDATTRATQFRAHVYEKITHKVYFCDTHAQACKIADDLMKGEIA